MALRPGARFYEPVSWEEAFASIGGLLKGLGSPDEAIFYTSGRASNEAAFLYQLFVRAFGTNNLPDCSNMCHESSGYALRESIGVGKGTVTLEDLQNAELILVVGQNPGTNHPRMLSALQQAKEKGARIVSVNPMVEAGLVAFAHPQRPLELLGGKTGLADLFARVKVNGDQALFLALAKRLLELAMEDASVIDSNFLEKFCTGYGEYRDHVESFDWEELQSRSGVPLADIHELARAIASSERIVSCWAMGLTQHRNAVATIQELVNLHLLRGAIGKKGAGLCPVRGHSNVQGDRTMGIFERMPESFLASLDREFSIQAPRNHGLNTVRAIRNMRANPGRVFFALGGNFLSASPDTEYTASALENCAATVHVSTKLNRSHLVTGKMAFILPCLGRSDEDVQKSGPQWVSVENSMGVVHASSGQLSPASSELKSEVAIVCGLAKSTLAPNRSLDWNGWEADYSLIRDRIERVVPGFDDYNRRARQPGGFYLPNAAKERRFETATGKANLTVSPLDTCKAENDELLLMTIRSHDQFNTTIYGLDDRYRGIRGERRVVFLNPDDMAERSLKAEEVVDVIGEREGQRRVAKLYLAIPYDLPRGCAAMYFPEANVLVPIEDVARESETPVSKSIPVKVYRHGSVE